MPKDYIPQNDREFLAWAENFLNMAQEFRVEARLSLDEIAALNDSINTFRERLAISDTKKAESVAATHDKDEARDTTESMLRRTVERVKVEPAVTDTMRIGMHITVPSGTRTRQEAQTPTHLFAELQGGGSVHLEWDAGGNSYGVQYIIERKSGISATGEFQMVGTTTRRSFTYTGADAAEPSMYRVRAQRGDTMSAYSNTVNIGF